MVGDTGLTLSSRGVCHGQNQVHIRGVNKDSGFRASDFADISVENSCIFSIQLSLLPLYYLFMIGCQNLQNNWEFQG